MVKTPEQKEERKPNAKRKHQNAPLMEHSMEKEEAESSKRRLLSGMEKTPVKTTTPQTRIPRSSKKLAELGFGGGKNHSSSLEKQSNLNDDEEEEEEEVKKTQIEEKFEEEEVKKTQGEKKIYPKTIKHYFDRKEKEEELKKMGSKRITLDGKSRTPQAQIGGKLRIGYSIDGKKLPKPEFGYSIDGTKLPKHPQIEGISKIIGACSDPFEKKLLKTDVERIGFHRDDVKNNGIYRILNDDEKAKLSKGGIVVDTYDEFGYRYEMKFDSHKNSFYRLCSGWTRLYKLHQLKENEDCYVDVWMFRNKDTDKVCFAVILKR